MAWEVLDGIYCRIVDTDAVLTGLGVAEVARPALDTECPVLHA
jgi:hypothetical protein